MLTTIIIIAVVAAIAIWAAKTAKQPTAPKFETKEEEPIGYETGSFSPIVEAKPKVKKTAAKPKAPKAPKKPKNA
jgi:hypothetical protein